ncbi:hypothetical protein [Williamsia sp.]|uniref:hypothetical protein n=1 Tax=Williamsia sp. TaxID=1872085 RepID=UPI002F94C05D
MSGNDFQIDQAGISEILNASDVRAMVDEAANAIANAARGQLDSDMEVGVESYTTDRPAASVAIMHPSGVGRQLKYGTLTRAAGIVGLTVSGGGK